MRRMVRVIWKLTVNSDVGLASPTKATSDNTQKRDIRTYLSDCSLTRRGTNSDRFRVLPVKTEMVATSMLMRVGCML